MLLQKRILKNGITVLHEPRPLPIVSLSITNKFGASFEESEIKGMAHLIEHLVFTGTKSRTHEQISKEIEKKGGILNAFTSHDVTSFLFKLPSEYIFAGLDILADILNNPLFEEQKFEKEKKVILEEIKMYHDMPMRHIHDIIEENLYEKPFGEGVVGSVKTISPMKRNFVAEYFKKTYNPKNFIVTIVGKANFSKVCEYLEKNFKSNKNAAASKKINLINKHTTEHRLGIDQAHFMLGFHAPKMSSPEHTVLEVMDAYLASGMSSKLFLEIREKRGLAYSVQSNLSTEKNYSYYSIYVGTTKQSIEKVKELILQGFKDMEKMTQENLAEAKQRLIGLKKITSEESSNVMNELMFYELTGKAEDYYLHEKKIKSVTLNQVKSLAVKNIKNYSTAAIVPK